MHTSLRRWGMALLVSVFVGAPWAVSAYTSPGAANGYVNDFADVLTSDQEAQLTVELQQYKERTTNEIGIATVQTTGDESIEQYAVQLFQEWGIGKKEKDNGVLLLLAIQDRKLRIEVGYGLEGILTDAKSAKIISGATPLLKRQDYGGAVQQMTDQLIGTLDGGGVPDALEEPQGSRNGEAVVKWIFIGVIAFMVLMALIPILIFAWFFINRKKFEAGYDGDGSGAGSTWTSSSRSSHSSSDSSSSSSSSDSFGGGSSGGGGASGSW